MIARQEDDNVRRYVHLATGNYNPTTAKLYTDMGLFTVDNEIADDVSALFNFLTGYSQGHKWNKLAVAPNHLQNRTIELIESQTRAGTKRKVIANLAKLNSLVDPKPSPRSTTPARAGVPIDLLVRGICCLRPGIEGVSENIRVRSIVDRYLEHSRIMVFGEGERAKVFLSSADCATKFLSPSRSDVPDRIARAPAAIHERNYSGLYEGQRKGQRTSIGLNVPKATPKDGEPYYRCQEELFQLNFDSAQQSRARHYRE